MPEENSAENIQIHNQLARVIEVQIKNHGPMPFDQYMDAWNNGLVDDDGIQHKGFYNTSSIKIGNQTDRTKPKEVDFNTFPEMTPLYGFLMARQIVEMWERLEKAPEFEIVEMGGGNGTMAFDIIHGLKYFAPDLDIKYTIVEQSPDLAKAQRERLKEYGVEVIEGSAVDDLPKDVKGVFISNELLDDLPAKMVRKKNGKWEELHLANNDVDRFSEVWEDADSEVSGRAEETIGDVDDLDIYPMSLAGEEWIREMASSLKSGFIITADYFKIANSEAFAVYSSENKGVIDEVTGALDHLHKDNSGKANITSAPNFRAIHLAGEEAGLSTVVDVTTGGFTKGLQIDTLAKELFDKMLLEKPGDEGVFGGRDFESIPARINLGRSTQRVLIQAKNVDAEELSGGKYTYPDEITDTRLFFREGFVPVRE